MQGLLSWILGVGLVWGGFSGKAFAAEEESPILLSHFELAELKIEQRVKYIQALRQLMLDLEKQQGSMGIRYQTALNLLVPRPFWQTLLDTADAQTVVEKGAPCIYAGGFSTYAASKPLTCINNNKCEGKPKQIECNPLLFGTGVCTAAKDGATARCMRDKNALPVEELARNLASASMANEWADFKKQFDAFCPGVFKNKKDINYKSCRLVEKRMNAIQKEIDKTPQRSTTSVAQAAAPVSRAEVIPGACGSKAVSGSCMACPSPELYTIRIEREVTGANAGSGKYGQLLKIMSKTCAVKNDDSVQGPAGVSARSMDELVKKFGVCKDEEFPGAGAYANDKQKAQILALVNGDSAAHQEMSAGLYYKGPDGHSENMQDYFGVNVKDARQIFCTGGSVADSLAILKRGPDFGPEPDSGFTPMQKEQFKKQTVRRQQLAACLGKNMDTPARRKVVDLKYDPVTCNLEVYSANANEVGPTLVKLSRENSVVCLDMPGGKTAKCGRCEDKGCPCAGDRVDPSAAAKLTVLKCPPPPSNARYNTPSGLPPAQ
ncbi:MAG: hypothetical protein AB7N80_01785 [Bdellovibrionales bacterium]